MDEKWTMIQEAILSVSEGKYQVELPDELGVDHLDSILMALKMMAETLSDREKIVGAIGAATGLDQGVLVLDATGRLQKFNLRAQELFQNKLREGDKLSVLFHNGRYLELIADLDAGMSQQELFEATLPNGSLQKVEMTVVRSLEEVGISGAVLQFTQR